MRTVPRRWMTVSLSACIDKYYRSTNMHSDLLRLPLLWSGRSLCPTKLSGRVPGMGRRPFQGKQDYRMTTYILNGSD